MKQEGYSGMVKRYESLFEHIRAKCQQEGWFGPDLDRPKHYEGVVHSDQDIDWIEPPADLKPLPVTAFVPANDPNRTGFVFARASEKVLQETEARLGFALPPLLRALYATVANGGFGPGQGIFGTLEGFGKPGT